LHLTPMYDQKRNGKESESNWIGLCKMLRALPRDLHELEDTRGKQITQYTSTTRDRHAFHMVPSRSYQRNPPKDQKQIKNLLRQRKTAMPQGKY